MFTLILFFDSYRVSDAPNSSDERVYLYLFAIAQKLERITSVDRSSLLRVLDRRRLKTKEVFFARLRVPNIAFVSLCLLGLYHGLHK